jgi:hypothetical protein
MPNDGPSTPHAVLAPATGVESTDDLFPLRFTPFEYYLWLDDSAAYPSVFFIRLECQGTLDREAFERAFQRAHARHPFLSARIECDRRGWPVWHAGEPAEIDWSADEIVSQRAQVSVVPREGLNARVSQRGESTVMSFAFHHVAVDGMGGFQFITDLMVAYAHECGSDAGPPRLPALKPALLRHRGGHSLELRKLGLMDLLRVARVGLSLQFVRAALVSDRGMPPEADSPDAPSPDYILHTLTEHETAQLSRVARKLTVRLHDLLLRDYFLMLSDWNQGTAEARHPIRVLVPTNLRRKQEYRMPGANVFGYAFLTRRARKCQDRAALLASIRDEMAHVKKSKAGVYYKATLRLLCLWPWMLRRSLARKWPFATAVFTNLNAGFDHVPLPWREGRRAAGDLLVEAGYGAGPIRPETRVSTAVHSYAGRMSIALLCDRQVFGAAEQRALLETYLDKLRLTIESES